MNHFQRLFSVAILVAIAIGCSPQGPPRTATYPVTGQVFVDGQPTRDVFSYVANAPAPILRVKQGQRLNVRLRNARAELTNPG